MMPSIVARLHSLSHGPPCLGKDFAGVGARLIVSAVRAMMSARIFRMTKLLRAKM
jgi:hypothetical protein